MIPDFHRKGTELMAQLDDMKEERRKAGYDGGK